MRPRVRGVLAGRRILIVEDEYFLADDLKHILIEQSAEVVGPVPTMKEALSVINGDQPIDCAVLDVNLSGSSVFPISAALMERKIPFLFATGYDSLQIPEQFRGVVRLEKPFAPSLLVTALEAIIGASAS